MCPSGRLCTPSNKAVRRGYPGYCAIKQVRPRSASGIKNERNSYSGISLNKGHGHLSCHAHRDPPRESDNELVQMQGEIK
jgi:hypothetical protein